VSFSIIDSEVVASNSRGLPDFDGLHFRDAAEKDLCVWSFDLQLYDSEDVRQMLLVEHKALLTPCCFPGRH